MVKAHPVEHRDGHRQHGGNAEARQHRRIRAARLPSSQLIACAGRLVSVRLTNF
jgi:hypothetical protein